MNLFFLAIAVTMHFLGCVNASAQDWGRHATATYTPPLQAPVSEWRQPFPMQTQSADAVRVAPKQFTFGTTAKDVGGKLYLVPDGSRIVPPPNIGENGRR